MPNRAALTTAKKLARVIVLKDGKRLITLRDAADMLLHSITASAMTNHRATDQHLPDTRRQFHKPSSWVSFDLPDRLSFQVRRHVMVAPRSGTNTRQGSVKGQAAKQPDPQSWGCNAGINKIRAQERKGEPDARTSILDAVDGHAQRSRPACCHCRLTRGSAHPSGRQATILRLAAFLAAVRAADRQAGVASWPAASKAYRRGWPPCSGFA